MKKRVQVSRRITAPIAVCYDWFYHSENFVQSPIVFQSKWRQGKKRETGAKRDILMVAGWYAEEITARVKNQAIYYRVFSSFPAIKQDYTAILFESLSELETLVTWEIEIEVPIPFLSSLLNPLAGRMAQMLYGTITDAGAKALEGKNYENQ